MNNGAVIPKRQKPLTIIAALSENFLIGRGNGLPWKIPEEYDNFLRLTAGQVLLMGRKSFGIFAGDLDDTTIFVLSRTIKHLAGAEVFDSLEGALIAAFSLPGRLFCGGGGEVYGQTIGLAEEMYLSVVRGSYEGDVYFPWFDISEWCEERRDVHKEFDFVLLRRKNERIGLR